MEKFFEFTRTVMHEGVLRQAGERLAASQFPDGSLQPCINGGFVVPCDPPAAPAPENGQDNEPKTDKAKPAKGKHKVKADDKGDESADDATGNEPENGQDNQATA